jgi:dihydropteroate synthase
VYPRRRFTIQLSAGRSLALGDRTLIMGVINVTPDSFSDGGLLLDPITAVNVGIRMVEEGAAILDIGGESTRPGAQPVGANEERAPSTPTKRPLRRPLFRRAPRS